MNNQVVRTYVAAVGMAGCADERVLQIVQAKLEVDADTHARLIQSFVLQGIMRRAGNAPHTVTLTDKGRTLHTRFAGQRQLVSV